MVHTIHLRSLVFVSYTVAAKDVVTDQKNESVQKLLDRTLEKLDMFFWKYYEPNFKFETKISLSEYRNHLSWEISAVAHFATVLVSIKLWTNNMLEISPNRKNCAIELTFSGIFIAFDASFVSVLHALCQRQHHVLPDGTHSRWKIATFTYLLFTDFPSKRFLSMCHRECPQTKLLSCDIQCAIQETPPPPPSPTQIIRLPPPYFTGRRM